MTRKPGPRETYSKEFRLEAIRLMEQSERLASEAVKTGWVHICPTYAGVL